MMLTLHLMLFIKNVMFMMTIELCARSAVAQMVNAEIYQLFQQVIAFWG